LLAAKECSKKTLKTTSLPDMVCKLAKNEEVEKMTISTVCTKQSKLPQDACEKGLTLIWNALAKRECPDGSVTALPPVVCKVVENSALEEQVVHSVCTKQTKIPASVCEQGLSKFWELLAAKECSKKTLKTTSLPDMVCKLAKNEEVEKMTISTVCTKQSKLPQDACEKGLTLIWNALAKRECPDRSVTPTFVV